MKLRLDFSEEGFYENEVKIYYICENYWIKSLNTM